MTLYELSNTLRLITLSCKGQRKFPAITDENCVERMIYIFSKLAAKAEGVTTETFHLRDTHLALTPTRIHVFFNLNSSL